MLGGGIVLHTDPSARTPPKCSVREEIPTRPEKRADPGGRRHSRGQRVVLLRGNYDSLRLTAPTPTRHGNRSFL